MEIKENTTVKIHYTGTLEDGTIFDSSNGKEPLEFIWGLGMIIPGLEQELKSLKKGDKKTIKVVPEMAYGPVMEEAKQEVPKTQFPEDMKIEKGMQLAAQGPQGVIPITVIEIKDETVLVDFNHPLAGKTLNFDVEVMEVHKTSDEELEKIIGTQPNESCSGGNCSPEKKKEGKCCGGSCKKE
jgi:peptidylprolyl isomerase